jgi:DNA polymerase-3 subunit delta'
MPLPVVYVSSNPEAIDLAIESYLNQLDLTAESAEVLYLNEKLGIDQIKKINQHFIWKNNQSSSRVVVLNPADSLTLDAQNGLLKILEESAEFSHIVMGINDESLLLPTVLSRCILMPVLTKSAGSEDFTEIQGLLELPVEDRFDRIEKEENRKSLTEKICLFYYSRLMEEPILAQPLKIVLTANSWIKQNVSAKAVTDYLMIKLPKYQK